MQRRALGTLNVLNSKWAMAMNFIKKIPFHFNISLKAVTYKWSGFYWHGAAEPALSLFQCHTVRVGAQVAWDITFCSGCLSEWFQSHRGRELSTEQGKYVCASEGVRVHYVLQWESERECFSELTFGNVQRPLGGSAHRGLLKKTPSWI